jgi:hypothetical protein
MGYVGDVRLTKLEKNLVMWKRKAEVRRYGGEPRFGMWRKSHAFRKKMWQTEVRIGKRR